MSIKVGRSTTFFNFLFRKYTNLRQRSNFIVYFGYNRLVKYINELSHSIHLSVNGFIKTRKIWFRLFSLSLYCLEISFTGFIIYFAIILYSNPRFSWLSLGLISALVMYYIEWFVKLIKRKEEY